MVIVDGHNRFRICTTHNIPFKTATLKLKARGDVVNWIITNQLGRRNLTDEQKSYLRGKRYRQEQKTAGAPESNKNASKQHGQSDHVVSTSHRIGAELGVAEATVRRDAKFADAVDAITKNCGEEAKVAALAGQLGTKEDIKKLAALPPEKQKTAVDGGKTAVKDAVTTRGSEGRPQLTDVATEAMQFAIMAISQLERIRPGDPRRIEALVRVETWIQAERTKA
jgi:hypothetical protein